MGKKIKIIVADDNRSLCQMLQNYLQTQEDLWIVGIANNGLEAWKLIQTQEPDLIILDLVMPMLDGLGVLERINSGTMINSPKIIMLTAFGQESLTQQVIMRGVDYFILKPFDLHILGRRIRSIAQEELSSTATQSLTSSTDATSAGSGLNLGVEVTSMMHQIGIPAHIKGYLYIRDAILMAVADFSLLGAVTKELYPGIAKKFDTAPGKVERGIRHAIDLAWDRGDTEVLRRIFGYSMNIERQKPSNSEFIAHLADKLRIMSMVS